MGRALAIIFGLALLGAGILGFLPNFVMGGKLFGIFAMNLEHNVAHIVTGVLGLLCGLSSGLAAKVYFIVVGILYALLSILGLSQGEGMLLCMFANNLADSWLHAGLSAVSLYIGLTCKS